jgi:hypothetical protein
MSEALTRLKRLLRRLRGPVLPVGPVSSGLCLCEQCGADFACPLEWESEDEKSWWIRLRCGACGHGREVVVDDAVASAFDEALGRQTARIQRAVDTLDRERMEAEVERFVQALGLGLVDAGDFA